MQPEVFVGIGAVLFFFFFFLFILLRSRGEIVRLWGNPVSYFPRMKAHRALRIKITRDVLRTLSDEVIKVVDDALLDLKQDETTKEVTLVAKQGVPKALAEKWIKIREHPENQTIWATFCKRRWRWQGEKGRWVFFYHFVSHDEMSLRFGRHKLWRVRLLPRPIGFYTPSQEEWVRMRMRESKKDLSKSLIRAFQKEYKREVKGRKWLLVLLHPTVTLTSEAQTSERIEGAESLVQILAHTLGTLSTDLAKVPYLEATVKGLVSLKRQMAHEIHSLQDRAGKDERLIRESVLATKRKGIPTTISPTHSPIPFAEPRPSKPETSRAKQMLKGEFPWTVFTLLAGFAMMFYGILLYSSDAANIGLLAFGSIVFLFGLIGKWREKRAKIPLVEEATDRIKEAAESSTEEG